MEGRGHRQRNRFSDLGPATEKAGLMAALCSDIGRYAGAVSRPTGLVCAPVSYTHYTEDQVARNRRLPDPSLSFGDHNDSHCKYYSESGLSGLQIRAQVPFG
jgi:hypothetical protein